MLDIDFDDTVVKGEKAFIKVNNNGQEVLKRYGTIKDDEKGRKLCFEESDYDSEDEEVPTAFDFLKKSKLVFVKEHTDVVKLTLDSHPGKALVYVHNNF